MLVFCNGMPRSASTWSFNVCRLLFRELRPRDSLCARYHENVAEVVDPLLNAYDHVVLKCHTLDERGRSLCRTQQAHSIYTHRDPHDAICSAMAMFGHSFESALDSIQRSLELCEFLRSTGQVCIVAYDTIRAAPHAAILSVARFLGLQPDAESLARIVEGTSVSALKAIADRVSLETGGVRTPRSMYDPETHIHRRHIQNGGTGYGKAMLADHQRSRIAAAMASHAPLQTV